MSVLEYKYYGFMVNEQVVCEHGYYDEIYVGKVLESDDRAKITTEKGTAKFMYVLYIMGVVNIEKFVLQGNYLAEEIYIVKLPELEPEEGDYQKIADIYKRLINCGILVKACTFVRRGNKVLMQLPQGIVNVHTHSNNNRIIVRCEYIMEDYIKNSLPSGMSYERIVDLVGLNEVEC